MIWLLLVNLKLLWLNWVQNTIMITIDVLELLGNVCNMIWHGFPIFVCGNGEDV